MPKNKISTAAIRAVATGRAPLIFATGMAVKRAIKTTTHYIFEASVFQYPSKQLGDGQEEIEVLADFRKDGSRIREALVVLPLSDLGTYKLVYSPSLLLGFAADDVISVGSEGRPVLVSRGSNLVVQIYLRAREEALEERLYGEVTGILSGRLDGLLYQNGILLLVFSVDISVGFSLVEATLNSAREYLSVLGMEWYYGNVYDPTDGVTPLNWWSQ